MHFKNSLTIQKENQIKYGLTKDKIWVDQGSEFYNSFLKKWLKDNHIKMFSTYNEGKSVVAERFIRILKKKSFNHMTVVSQNVYFDDLVHNK